MTENSSTEQGRNPEPMQLETVQNFVKENLVPTKSGRRCVDGRYKTDSIDSGTIARAGGDLGYAMILLGLSKKYNLGINPQRAFDTIYQIVTEDNGKFYMHTDHHSDPDGEKGHEESEVNTPASLIGCGHAAKAMNPSFAPSYGIDAKDVEELINYAKDKASKDPKIQMTNLVGEHGEDGVLIVKGDTMTVDPQNRFFVYDIDRDDEFMTMLVKKINNPQIDLDRFKQVSDAQTNATLHLLAANKPIFQFNGDGENPLVTPVGLVS